MIAKPRNYCIKRSKESANFGFGEIAEMVAQKIEIKPKRIIMNSDRCYGLEPTNSVRISVGDDVIILWDWHGKPPPDAI